MSSGVGIEQILDTKGNWNYNIEPLSEISEKAQGTH